MNPLEMGLSAVILGTLTWGGIGHLDAMKLENKLEVANQKLIVCKHNNQVCKFSLEKQNQEIEDMRIDYEGRLTKFEPTVVEVLVPVPTITGDCNETSDVLDFIRTNHP